WIFRDALALWRGAPLPDPPSVHEQREGLREHRELAERAYGPDRWLGVMRKFGYKYARLHPELDSLRREFGQLRNRTDWDQLIDRFYAIDAPGLRPQVD